MLSGFKHWNEIYSWMNIQFNSKKDYFFHVKNASDFMPSFPFLKRNTAAEKFDLSEMYIIF
jgi:hypothetical protein